MVDVDTLKEKMVVGMDPGIFYNDSQKVYYSTIPNRSEDYSGNYEFHLKVQAIPNVKWLDTDSVLDTLATHKLLSFGAITTLIEDNYVANPFNEYNNNDLFDGNWYYGMITNGVSFADNNLSTPLDDDFEIEWDETENGERYELVLRFHYTEQMTDLSSVFELFVFSDVLELNREILKEGSSLILTLFKNVSNDENRLTRINVQKIASLKNLYNSPINEVSFDINSEEQIKKISTILKDYGKTVVNINLVNENNVLQFRLKNTRKLDRKSLNLLRNQEIQAIIN